MLPKNRRITLEKEWQRIHRGGFSAYSPRLIVKYTRNQPLSRFGIITGTKISKKSNIRNLVKRRLSAFIQVYLPKIKNGYDIIFICRPGINKLSYQGLEELAVKLLTKANLLPK